MARYPGATWKGDGVSGGLHIGVPPRVVLHTTETRGVPGYSDGASAPHFTYSPSTRKWVQHTDTATAARALKNLGGGVETNRANCIQVEIVAYSARGIADIVGGLWIANLNQTQLDDIRTFLSWTFQFGVRMVWPGKQALSYAAANAPGFRMSGSEWLAFNGVCGHQHVPENTHWDPGALAWGNLHLANPNVPLPPEPDMPLDQIGKAVVDIAFDLLGAQPNTPAARDYWYAKEPDDPELENLREAIRAGAVKLKGGLRTAGS